jgi:hypothetical protein
MHGFFVRVLPALLLLVAAPAHLHAQDSQADLQQLDELCLDTTFDQAAPSTPPAATQAREVMTSLKGLDQRFDSLLQKMNAATGTAKMEAAAELLLALVEDRRNMHDWMMTHMTMMLSIMQRLGDCEAAHFCRPQ